MDEATVPTPVKSNYISNPFQMVSPSANALGCNIGTLFALLGFQLLPVLLLIITIPFALLSRGSAIVSTTAFVLGAIAVVGLIGIALISVPAFTIILLESVKRQKITLRAALTQAKPFVWRMLWMEILLILAVLGGLILFIVPGLIFIAWFSVAQYAMVTENLSATASLKRSRELVRGRVWEMWSLSMLPGIVNAVPILGGLVSFVLSIVLIPAFALRYTQLAATPAEKRPKVHWSNYGLIVLILVLGITVSAMGLNKVKSVEPQINTSTYSY